MGKYKIQCAIECWAMWAIHMYNKTTYLHTNIYIDQRNHEMQCSMNNVKIIKHINFNWETNYKMIIQTHWLSCAITGLHILYLFYYNYDWPTFLSIQQHTESYISTNFYTLLGKHMSHNVMKCRLRFTIHISMLFLAFI